MSLSETEVALPRPEPPERAAGPELTARSIVVGLVVALLIGSAYPYCVLKLGFGPNLSVVSAFLGFIILVLILRAAGTNARENNIVQTMGTSAGQTAFMCVLLAAFDLLNSSGVLNPPIHLGTMQIFAWLCSASILGIALPLSRAELAREIEQAIQLVPSPERYVRIMITRGDTPVALPPVLAGRARIVI